MLLASLSAPLLTALLYFYFSQLQLPHRHAWKLIAAVEMLHSSSRKHVQEIPVGSHAQPSSGRGLEKAFPNHPTRKSQDLAPIPAVPLQGLSFQH